MNKNYELSFTSKECIDSIKNRISVAKISIDIEMYYFINDNIGSQILNILKQKANEGLKIRVLFDQVGSFKFSKETETLKELQYFGIKILFFNSILPFSKNRKTFWFLRDHRRTIIVDSEYLFTGSVCISNATIHWKELGIFIRDKELALKTQLVFNKTWSKVYHPTFNIGSTVKKDLVLLNSFNYTTQSPLQFKRHIYRYYIKSIKASRESIYLISPYFVPDRRLKRQLIRASKRHNNVHIIIPKNTEIPVVDIARNTYIKQLLTAGVHIYFHNEMVHSKFSVFDNKQAFIGTLNLDNLSLKYNYECGVVILNNQCISELNNYIKDGLIPSTTKLTVDSWNKRSFLTKFVEKFIWLFRKFL
jgi:cardiolipin synthase